MVSAWGRSNGWWLVNAYWAVGALVLELYFTHYCMCAFRLNDWPEILQFLLNSITARQTKRQAVDEGANLFPQTLLLVSRALIVDFVQPLIDFLLLCRAPAKEHVIYKGIFEQGKEHKHKTAHEVDVDGFHIWNLWESLPKVGVNCCHGEHRCHTWV